MGLATDKHMSVPLSVVAVVLGAQAQAADSLPMLQCHFCLLLLLIPGSNGVALRVSGVLHVDQVCVRGC